jgi:peptidoglycan/xylan/chitin deacetylase (PgdA/CDA1 family)
MAKTNRILQIFDRLSRRKPRPVILMYHRVARVRHDPWGIAVDPEHFEEQMDYVKRKRSAMAMDELVRHLNARTLPADAVAITFDDGYRDNLVNAKAVLTRYSLPACLFLATGYVDRGQPFWWDELAAMTLESIVGVHCEQVCGSETIVLDWAEADTTDDTASEWKAWEEPRTARQKAYLAIWRILRGTTEKERSAVMESLRLRFATKQDPLAMAMNAEEVRSFREGGLITIGAHSVTHSALTGLSKLERQREIELSGQRCRALSDMRVTGFAYPHGDMNLEVQRDVEALGYSWACSTEGAWLTSEEHNLYALPRIGVPSAPLRTFISLL